MNYKSAVCAGLMALGAAAGATPAQAQLFGDRGFYGGPRGYYPPPMYEAGIPPGEVLMIVRAAGLRPLTQPALRGSRYVLLTSDNMGGQLRVFVNARNGRIVHASPAHDPRFAYEPARPRALVPGPGQELRDPPPVIYGSRTPASRDSGPLPPSGATPDERIANAPPAADPAPRRPARTPLPRPRPDTAANTTQPAPEAAPVAAAPQPAAPAQTPAAPAAAAPQNNPPAAAPTELVPVAPLE